MSGLGRLAGQVTLLKAFISETMHSFADCFCRGVGQFNKKKNWPQPYWTSVEGQTGRQCVSSEECQNGSLTFNLGMVSPIVTKLGVWYRDQRCILHRSWVGCMTVRTCLRADTGFCIQTVGFYYARSDWAEFAMCKRAMNRRLSQKLLRPGGRDGGGGGLRSSGSTTPGYVSFGWCGLLATYGCAEARGQERPRPYRDALLAGAFLGALNAHTRVLLVRSIS